MQHQNIQLLKDIKTINEQELVLIRDTMSKVDGQLQEIAGLMTNINDILTRPAPAQTSTWDPNLTLEDLIRDQSIRNMYMNSDDQVLAKLVASLDQMVQSDTFQQLAYGPYSGKVTLGGTLTQMGAGLFGLDVGWDIQSIKYDIDNWEWSLDHAGTTTLDVVSLLPGIGLLKYSDEAADVLTPALKACNCFVAGTKVLTDDGEKNIEDIKVGDNVLSKDETTGEVAYKEVTATFNHETDEIYKIHVGGQTIESTFNHPFYVQGKGWTFVKDLKPGDLLVRSDGNTLKIDSVELLHKQVTVYNMTVDEFHTYFVSDLGIWVHNTNPCWSKMSADDFKKLAQADQKDIKQIKGNANDAWDFFNAQVDKSTISEVKPGVFVGKDSNGVTFTYRSESTYGNQEPTININGINGVRKIKFTD